MKYFLHDTNSFQDEKISLLFIEFGYEGLGLFYTILEKIGAQEKPIKSIVLKKQLQIGKKLEKVWKFLEEIDLISTKNGDTFNLRILSYAEKYKVSREKNREKVEKFRRNVSENEVVENNVPGYETVTLPVGNTSKVKRSKVKEVKGSKEEITHTSDLKNSNLFRQPIIPKIENVIEYFLRAGGNEEMAIKFFNKNEGLGWFLNGSPIMNFNNLVPSYIDNWKKNENNKRIPAGGNRSKNAGADQLLNELKSQFNGAGKTDT